MVKVGLMIRTETEREDTGMKGTDGTKIETEIKIEKDIKIGIRTKKEGIETIKREALMIKKEEETRKRTGKEEEKMMKKKVIKNIGKMKIEGIGQMKTESIGQTNTKMKKRNIDDIEIKMKGKFQTNFSIFKCPLLKEFGNGTMTLAPSVVYMDVCVYVRKMSTFFWLTVN